MQRSSLVSASQIAEVPGGPERPWHGVQEWSEAHDSPQLEMLQYFDVGTQIIERTLLLPLVFFVLSFLPKVAQSSSAAGTGSAGAAGSGGASGSITGSIAADFLDFPFFLPTVHQQSLDQVVCVGIRTDCREGAPVVRGRRFCCWWRRWIGDNFDRSFRFFYGVPCESAFLGLLFLAYCRE